MCGIVGYVGDNQALSVLLDGLKRLEYRGYDSAGICVISDGELKIKRSKGKIVELQKKLDFSEFTGSIGIGHTRWATHGEPSDANAHPHRAGDIAIVHNGIIENYLELKQELKRIGHTFKSETDTEVIAHLIQQYEYEGNSFFDSIYKALNRLKGSFALVILNRKYPDRLIVAKNASPLIVALGDGENFVASDVPAILSYSRKYIVLEEGQFGVVTRDSVKIYSIKDKKEVKYRVNITDWSPVMAEKGGYKHFMLKEIFEQPRALVDTIRGRVNLDKGEVEFETFSLEAEELKGIKRILISACGTSYHAAMIGKYYIEKYVKIPVETIIASEFQYQNTVLDKNDLFVVISQSGETADTLESIKIAKSNGCKVLSVCNVLGSSIPRASDYVIYTHAGPEISVASTKAFSTQIAVLYMLAIYLARKLERIDENEALKLLKMFIEVPNQMEQIVKNASFIYDLSKENFEYQNMLYLGRGINYPVALEGALKLKEISYIHAEGYPAGEMKHGPIALIDEKMPVVIIATKGAHYERIFGNLREVKARKAKVIAIATEGDEIIKEFADNIIFIEDVFIDFQPFLVTLPLQLFAYYIADIRGTDVDQPRNLAKSVTVF